MALANKEMNSDHISTALTPRAILLLRLREAVAFPALLFEQVRERLSRADKIHRRRSLVLTCMRSKETFPPIFVARHV